MGKFNFSTIRILELILLFLFGIGMVLRLLDIYFSSIIILFSLFALSFCYLFLGVYFFRPKQKESNDITLSIISGIMLAPTPIGVFFTIFDYPIADTFLLVSSSLILFALIITLIIRKKGNSFYSNMIKRNLIILLVSLFFLTII